MADVAIKVPSPNVTPTPMITMPKVLPSADQMVMPVPKRKELDRVSKRLGPGLKAGKIDRATNSSQLSGVMWGDQFCGRNTQMRSFYN